MNQIIQEESGARLELSPLTLHMVKCKPRVVRKQPEASTPETPHVWRAKEQRGRVLLGFERYPLNWSAGSSPVSQPRSCGVTQYI